MNRKRMKLIGILGLGLSLSLPVGAWAGKESSGGVDNLRPSEAWFLGADRTVKVCYELAPGFGVDPALVPIEIARAFATWADYIGTRNLTFPTLAPATKVDVRTKCQGGEDLRFYFNMSSPEVEREKLLYEDPIALAHRTSYDPATGWGRGFIWFSAGGEVAPPLGWKARDAFFGVLLHEVGHVLGNGHVPGTIMAADLFQRILFFAGEPTLYAGLLNRIDHASELRPAIRQAAEYVSVETAEGSGQSSVAASFQLLAKRPPVGPLKAKVTMKKEKELPSGALVFTEADGKESVFPFKMYNQASYVELSSGDIFRVVYTGDPHAAQGSAMGSYGMVFIGELQDAAGGVVPVNLNWNLAPAGSGSELGSFEIKRIERKRHGQRLFAGRRLD
jgi:hypothetical protein